MDIKVSVLMSVYNETDEEIKISVQSIIDQTFEDFELIIINDSPNNVELRKLLDEIKEKDSRIRVFCNDTNMGLAKSMNRAASLAKGRYYARMDADDISELSRLEREVEVLDSGMYDFVFSGYTYINESGVETDQKVKYQWYSDETIKNVLVRDNIIHHPTVMMTKEIFNKVGGYRGFPCAQDYDLWLRLLHASCRFHMIDKSLLKYRIRGSSTTSKRSLQQKWTIEYSLGLYIERLETGKDSFSEDNYKKHIEYMHNKYANAEKQFIEDGKKLIKAKKCKDNKNLFGYFYYRINVFLTSSIYRDSYLLKRKNLKIINQIL